MLRERPKKWQKDKKRKKKKKVNQAKVRQSRRGEEGREDPVAKPGKHACARSHGSQAGLLRVLTGGAG